MTEGELDGVILKQTASGIYQTDNKKTYRLVRVDREYSGKKAPVYYLQRLEGGKAEYISGVFETGKQDILSMDLKDRLGIKTYFDIVIKGGGKELEIRRRAASLSKS